MKSVIGYTRVSTDGQVGEDKFGLEEQKNQILDYCVRNDMEARRSALALMRSSMGRFGTPRMKLSWLQRVTV